jgi:hypothetical protein
VVVDDRKSGDFRYMVFPFFASSCLTEIAMSRDRRPSPRITAAQVPLPGFALADSEVMYGDSLEQPMLWKNNPDLGKWAGSPVRLRFVLKDADLFSLRFR